MIRVERPGLLTTVQDLGRPGLAHLGVPAAGAADVDGLRRANAAVGNPPGAAALEVTAVGPVLRPEVDVTLWLHGRAVFVPAGRAVDVGPVRDGLRGYVAVRGGVDVPAVLGSRATCTLSGLGPAPLRAGDVLPVGRAAVRPVPPSVPAAAPLPDPLPLRVDLGPRDDALTADGLAALLGTDWLVDGRSDRAALRLDGPPLARARTGELASEGVVLGAVQVPPDGRPVVFLANHPTTGGYPVVGVVRAADAWRAGRVPPGRRVRFRLA